MLRWTILLLTLQVTFDYHFMLMFATHYVYLTKYLMAVQMSSWNLVLLTAERIVSVWLPFKCKELCSRRRIVAAWCGIAIVIAGINLHFFFTFSLMPVTDHLTDTNSTHTYLDCYFYEQFSYFWFQQWYWIDACIQDFIPFGIIFFGNVFIVSRIVIANRLRTGQMQAAGTKEDKGKGRKVLAHSIIIRANLLEFFSETS